MPAQTKSGGTHAYAESPYNPLMMKYHMDTCIKYNHGLNAGTCCHCGAGGGGDDSGGAIYAAAPRG